MPWYLYLACKQLFPSGRFPFFTAISVLGVTLGVAVLIIVTSVMGGFGYEIRRMIVETEGEVDVKATGYLSDPKDVLAQISATPGVAAATPYVKGVVGVQANGRPAYPIFRASTWARLSAWRIPGASPTRPARLRTSMMIR